MRLSPGQRLVGLVLTRSVLSYAILRRRILAGPCSGLTLRIYGTWLVAYQKYTRRLTQKRRQMDSTNIAGLVVSVIATVVGYMSAKSANKASIRNTELSARFSMEDKAYERARKFDTDTIERQDKEIEELRGVNQRLEIEVHELKEANRKLSDVQEKNEALNREVEELRNRIARIEGGLPPVPLDPPEVT